jgi:hypothetical protein
MFYPISVFDSIVVNHGFRLTFLDRRTSISGMNFFAIVTPFA